MNVLDAIRRKRAVRSYQDRPLPPETVEQILYAGRRAQSSKNLQPWHFIAVQDRDTLRQLAAMGDFASYLPTAALAVLLITPDPATHYAVMFDTGQAAAYMQLAGVELGVGSCMITLHRPEGAPSLLGFPPDMHARFLVAFGYPTDPEAAFEPARPRTEGRKPTTQIVHYERFGNNRPPAEQQ